MTIRCVCRTIIVVSIMTMFLTGCCAEILDGPFNQGKYVTPALLSSMNSSSYVTYWDEESKSYRTYDQDNNIMLAEAIFEEESESGGSQNFMMTDSAVVPLTQLDEDELAVQREEGCGACHVEKVSAGSRSARKRSGRYFSRLSL